MKNESKFWIGYIVFIILFISGTLIYQQYERDKQYQESDFRPINVTVLDKHNVTELWEAEDDTYTKKYMAVECFNHENNLTEIYITGQDRWNEFPIGLNCTIGQGSLQ